MLDRIKNELFVKGVNLICTADSVCYGKITSSKDIFYHQNEQGYFLYLPKVQSIQMFDPIEPTSFRWCLFNRQIIYVPHSNVPFKKLFKVHPNMDDYLIRFNLEYFNRYKKVFVESNDIRQDQFFLIRRPLDYCIDFDTMLPVSTTTVEEFNETIIEKKILTTSLTNVLPVMPEFLNSNNVLKTITSNNVDDIWKHWLAAQYGDRMFSDSDHYYKLHNNDEWIDKIVSHLVFENLLEKEKPRELDPELKRLLGIK